MTKIHAGRVAVGGIAAGVVFTLGGMASAVMMGLPETFARFDVEATGGSAFLHVILRFGLGLASVLVYVLMRPSLGPGPWTAFRVGLLVWFLAYVPGSFVLHQLGALDGGQLAVALVWGAAEAVAATMLGAWLYREMDEEAGATGASPSV